MLFFFILVLTNACDLDLFSLQDIGTSYARLFALSRSEPHEICELVSLMLIGGASLDTINELLLLASRQKPQTGRVGKTVQQTLKVVLESFRLVFQIIISVGAGAVLGKGAGGVHLPAWDDLQLSNITSQS